MLVVERGPKSVRDNFRGLESGGGAEFREYMFECGTAKEADGDGSMDFLFNGLLPKESEVEAR